MSNSPAEASGPADETQIQPSVDETRVVPGGDATRVEPEAPRWTARAGVPSPGDPRLRQPAPPQEWVGEEEEDPYQGRAWYTPVVVGVVAVVLVAALSVGLWLIYRATVNGENAPGEVVAPSSASSAAPSAAPSSAPPESSAPPSSEAPPPSSAPPPGLVVIPPLRGDSLAEATVKLQVLGLNVEVQRRPDDSLPPGEVLATEPDTGQQVPAGSTVTVIVASAPSPAPPASPAGSPSAG
ncbi:PASTA domain-containing protein [Dactylosporangium sp. CA-092794]|uniref:PASTA domain-containing protein n=1 Tax=Dactylosporangium sp. CA-092794 TaxID=3239929 RepID=UPI003D941F18